MRSVIEACIMRSCISAESRRQRCGKAFLDDEIKWGSGADMRRRRGGFIYRCILFPLCASDLSHNLDSASTWCSWVLRLDWMQSHEEKGFIVYVCVCVRVRVCVKGGMYVCVVYKYIMYVCLCVSVFQSWEEYVLDIKVNILSSISLSCFSCCFTVQLV